ncbi:MAG: hypothetical protein F4140_07455 [Cenarchaeum sp. SB0675_bin_21]|nr:hypothetical protein [Cenarchaeum sp. SB0675_bin_21]
MSGTASDPDPEDDNLTYLWTHNHPGLVLNDADSPNATFTAPNVSADIPITFTLTVSDGTATATDHITITIADSANTPPTADAGSNLVLASGAQATITGSATDPDQADTLTFQWLQNPSDAGVVFESPNSLTTTITAPEVDSITQIALILRVSDGTDSHSAAILLIVTPSTP